MVISPVSILQKKLLENLSTLSGYRFSSSSAIGSTSIKIASTSGPRHAGISEQLSMEGEKEDYGQEIIILLHSVASLAADLESPQLKEIP
jgi:hypothetical protein